MQGRVLPEQVHNTYSTTLQDSMCIVACWLLRGLAYLYLAGGKPPASTPPLLGVIFAHASSPKRAVTRLPRLLWRRRVWLFSRLRSSRATPLAIPPLCRSDRLAVNLLLASRLVAVVGARVAVCVTGQLRAGACNTTQRPWLSPIESIVRFVLQPLRERHTVDVFVVLDAPPSRGVLVPGISVPLLMHALELLKPAAAVLGDEASDEAAWRHARSMPFGKLAWRGTSARKGYCMRAAQCSRRCAARRDRG